MRLHPGSSEAMFHNQVPHPKKAEDFLTPMFETFAGFKRSVRKSLRKDSKRPLVYVEQLKLHSESMLMPSYMQYFSN